MVALFLIVGYLVVSYLTLFRGLREGVTRAIEQSSPVTITTGAEPSTVAMTPATTSATTTTTLPPGLTWEQVPLGETVFPSGSLLVGATSWGGQAVVVGQSGGVGDMHAAVWLSEDGRDWTAHVLDSTDVSIARGVAAWRDRLVVVGGRYHGRSGSDGVVWVSQDGSDWTEIFDDEPMFKGGDIYILGVDQWGVASSSSEQK